MTLRVTASPITIAANLATDTEIKSTIAALTSFVPSGTLLNPRALTLVDAPDVGITVNQVVIRSEKNPEVQHRVYKGPHVPLSKVLGAFERDALKNAILTNKHFVADHGLELVLTCKSGGTGLTSNLLWDVQNQVFEPPSQIPSAVQELVSQIQGITQDTEFSGSPLVGQQIRKAAARATGRA